MPAAARAGSKPGSIRPGYRQSGARPRYRNDSGPRCRCRNRTARHRRSLRATGRLAELGAAYCRSSPATTLVPDFSASACSSSALTWRCLPQTKVRPVRRAGASASGPPSQNRHQTGAARGRPAARIEKSVGEGVIEHAVGVVSRHIRRTYTVGRSKSKACAFATFYLLFADVHTGYGKSAALWLTIPGLC